MLRLLSRTSAREELRLQVGTLRFDLNTLSSKLDKSKRKQVEGLKKTFLKEVCLHRACSSDGHHQLSALLPDKPHATLAAQADNLDFAIRQKDQGKASSSLVAVKSSLDQVLSSVM